MSRKVYEKTNYKKIERMEELKQIRVTVQTENRLCAINNLSEAVLGLAKALVIAPRVEISGCTIYGGNPAIEIDTAAEVEGTEILKMDEGEIE